MTTETHRKVRNINSEVLKRVQEYRKIGIAISLANVCIHVIEMACDITLTNSNGKTSWFYCFMKCNGLVMYPTKISQKMLKE